MVDVERAADELDRGGGPVGLRDGDDVVADDAARGLDADVGAVDDEPRDKEDLAPEEDALGPVLGPVGIGGFHHKSFQLWRVRGRVTI